MNNKDEKIIYKENKKEINIIYPIYDNMDDLEINTIGELDSTLILKVTIKHKNNPLFNYYMIFKSTNLSIEECRELADITGYPKLSIILIDSNFLKNKSSLTICEYNIEEESITYDNYIPLFIEEKYIVYNAIDIIINNKNNIKEFDTIKKFDDNLIYNILDENNQFALVDLYGEQYLYIKSSDVTIGDIENYIKLTIDDDFGTFNTWYGILCKSSGASRVKYKDYKLYEIENNDNYEEIMNNVLRISNIFK